MTSFGALIMPAPDGYYYVVTSQAQEEYLQFIAAYRKPSKGWRRHVRKHKALKR